MSHEDPSESDWNEDSEDEWQEWWDARIDAMRPILGNPADIVFHSPDVFQLGGFADVIMFENHIPGIVLVTNDLIGDDQQIQNDDGWYELMVCLRSLDDWPAAPTVLSRLARYTTQACLKPGQTMDIGSAVPPGSSVSAFLFVRYASLTARECPSTLLLCLGITQAEMNAWHNRKVQDLAGLLKSKGVFPYTRLNRPSVV